MTLHSFRLDGKVALVTGASAGLGRAIAIALAEVGADVSCHGNTRSPEDTCGAIQQSGSRAFAVTGDLAKPETSQAIFEQTREYFGQVDILVNNAGTIRRSPATEYSEEDWATVIEVNLSSVFRLSQQAGRHMIERGSGGKIVNIASLLSFQVESRFPLMPLQRVASRNLRKHWRMSGPNSESTLTPLLLVTCEPATRLRYSRMRRETGRYWKGFLRDVGENRRTSPEPQYFSLPVPAIT